MSNASVEEFERLANRGGMLVLEKPEEARPLLEQAHVIACQLGLDHEAAMMLILLARQDAYFHRNARAIHILRRGLRDYPCNAGVVQAFTFVVERMARQVATRGHSWKAAVLMVNAAKGYVLWSQLQDTPDRTWMMKAAEELLWRASKLSSGVQTPRSQ